MATLEAISHVAVDPFLPEIKSLLVSNAHSSVKTYAFLLLINCKYDEEVSLVKGDVTYHLIPKNVNPPFVGPDYRTLKQGLESFAKDPSLSSVAYSLFSDYALALFPISPFAETSEPLLVATFLSLALDYLKDDSDRLSLLELGVKDEELNAFKKKASSLLASIAPLSE